MSQLALHDYAGVVHLHSTHSDGTGTVAQIAQAGRENGLDFVLLTDHDSLAARRLGQEGWYAGTLLLAGIEVSPYHENHYLAFGLEDEIEHDGLDSGQICDAVAGAGGFGFLAHPFSKGNPRFRRSGTGMPWRDLDCGNYTGIELWSFVTDTGEWIEGLRDMVRFVGDPLSIVDHPPQENLRQWDRLCQERPVVAIGGLDAHQLGVRIGDRVPLRLMAYRRSFRHLRTHVLDQQAMSGDVETDRRVIFDALRAGRCYLAMDSLEAAGGFRFWAERGRKTVALMGEERKAARWRLMATVPLPARLRLLRDGEPILDRESTTSAEVDAPGPGVYRIEAWLQRRGRWRTWILSNPIYLR